MEIKQLIDEVIRKKFGIKDGLHVEKATVTVCAGSDEVIIESVLMMAGRQGEVDTRPPSTPKPTKGRRGGGGVSVAGIMGPRASRIRFQGHL